MARSPGMVPAAAVGAAGSALLKRRGLLTYNVPRVECEAEDCVNSSSEMSSPELHTATTAECGPWSSASSENTCSCISEEEARETERATSPSRLATLEHVRPTLLQRRKKAFKLEPRITCNAVVAEEDMASDPFGRATCSDLTDRFYVLETLGQGTTGVVYRARQRGCNNAQAEQQLCRSTQVALKVMRMHDEELLKTASEEYHLLRNVDHPNIIQAVDFFTYAHGAVLVLEFFDGYRLDTAIAQAESCHVHECVLHHGQLQLQSRGFEETTARGLFLALMRAVEYLHRHNIIHRDVKGDNVLVSKDLQDLRLVDFNTATRTLNGGSLTLTGTADYMPPEVLLGEPASETADIWSSGLCLHLILTGKLPLRRKLFSSHGSFGHAMRARFEAPLPVSQCCHLSSLCKEVVARCLTVDCTERPNAVEILRNEWFF